MTLPFERPASDAGTATRLPRLSVVVISTAERAHLERCLAMALAEYGTRAHEIIVVRGADADAGALQRTFGGIRFVAVPGATAERLRAAAMREAEGEVIALMHDAAILQPLPPRVLGR